MDESTRLLYMDGAKKTRAELLELRYQSKPASFHDRKMTVHKELSPADLLMVWYSRADLLLS
jgi:hypothetical protein